MPWAGFEPTIPAFKRAKTFHASNRAATVIGAAPITRLQWQWFQMESHDLFRQQIARTCKQIALERQPGLRSPGSAPRLSRSAAATRLCRVSGVEMLVSPASKSHTPWHQCYTHSRSNCAVKAYVMLPQIVIVDHWDSFPSASWDCLRYRQVSVRGPNSIILFQ
jgi:hypothetical protein